MADNTAISTVYNHFLTTYAPQGTNSKYDTHKKSELRGLYNSIVKMNKEAPLFLLDTSPATQEFAVGLKESARSLKNVILSLLAILCTSASSWVYLSLSPLLSTSLLSSAIC